MDLEAAVRNLVDDGAVRDLVRRYAHCVWQGDAAGAAALFADDAEMDTGDRPPLKGRVAILTEYEISFAASCFRPFVHNHVISLSGDHGTGTVYLDLEAIVEGRRMEGFGWYDDEYIRTAEGWRFDRRKLNLVHYAQAKGPASNGSQESDSPT